MANHVWTLVCTKAVIDQQSQNLSIHDVIDEMTVEITTKEKVPDDFVVPVPFVIVSVWERSQMDVPEDKESCQFRIVNPKGKELSNFEQVFSMLGPHVRSRVIVNVQGMPMQGAGRYEIQVLGKKGTRWQKVATVPLVLKFNVKEPLPPPPTKS